MNNLQVFTNNIFGSVRAVEYNNEIYFVGKDVALSLGYTNPQKAIRDHVDNEDRTVNDSFTVNGTPLTLINESGLYSLVLTSKLEGAKKFKRWITSEVIPTIRKHGAYMTDDVIKRTLQSPDFIIRLATELKSEQEARRLAKSAIEAQRPKVLFADAVSSSDSSILIGELAKLLKQNGYENIGQNRLFELLRKEGFLISRKGTDYNMPTQKSMEMGLFTIKETVINHSDGHISVSKTPKVTGKGQLYFINRYVGNFKTA